MSVKLKITEPDGIYFITIPCFRWLPLFNIAQTKDGQFHITSPAKFIDLHAPADFTKPINPPEVISNNEVVQWSFQNITLPQFEHTKKHVQKDSASRRKFLESASTEVIMDI